MISDGVKGNLKMSGVVFISTQIAQQKCAFVGIV